MKKTFRCVMAMVLALALGACLSSEARKKGPTVVQKGHKVKVNYVGKIQEGLVFDSSLGIEPLEVLVGSGAMIPGFENALVGMELASRKNPDANRKTVVIKPEEAYGLVDDTKIVQVNKSQIPDNLELVEGAQLTMNLANGAAYPVRVIEVEENAEGDAVVHMDANHLLAGKTLVFDIELLSIEDPDASKPKS